MNFTLKSLFASLFLLGSLLTQGQDRNMDDNSGRTRSSSSNKKQSKIEKGVKDSIVFKMHEFKLLDNLTRIGEVKVDTSIVDFHIYSPPYKN